MKRILVPTDFSECSINALNYAGALCKFTEAKIYLLHVYQLQVPATDVPVIEIDDTEKLEKEFMHTMHRIVKEEKKKHGWSAEVSSSNSIGITSLEISSFVKENKIDLIIMGMRGKATVADKLFGSNATEMIKKAPCPLLLIPEQTTFQPPDRIAVAFDVNSPEDVKKLGITRHIINTFNSNLLAFSIINEVEDASKKAVVFDTINNIIKDFKHSIHFNIHHDVSQGILSFIDEHKTNMIVMFHHSHNIFARIFATVNSKEIAFRIKIPLMVINEKAKNYPTVNL